MNRMVSGNLKRELDDLQQKKLGTYVYILRDPRDGRVFYVGQGVNNRVFGHFTEADNLLESSGKVQCIREIWAAGKDVEWEFVAHNLEANQADVVESAVIDVLKASRNGPCANKNSGNKSSFLSQEGLREIGAEPINPNFAFKRVFIFPIKNSLIDGRDYYEATRKSWAVTQEWQKCSQDEPSYAVGLKNGVSFGSYKIKEWLQDEEHKDKCQFVGEDFSDFKDKSWIEIIKKASGFWQRGNYLVVEFDGNGRVRILRGAGRSPEWVNI